jgi:hypothetical protein
MSRHTFVAILRSQGRSNPGPPNRRSARHARCSVSWRRPVFMLHAGLDLSRRKVDVCLLSSAGEIVDEWASPPDADGLRGLAARAGMWAPGGAWGDRVDERRAVRARPARGARLGRADRRRHQGQGAGAAGLHERKRPAGEPPLVGAAGRPAACCGRKTVATPRRFRDCAYSACVMVRRALPMVRQCRAT